MDYLSTAYAELFSVHDVVVVVESDGIFQITFLPTGSESDGFRVVLHMQIYGVHLSVEWVFSLDFIVVTRRMLAGQRRPQHTGSR